MALDLTKFVQANNFKNDGNCYYGLYHNRVLTINVRQSYVDVIVSLTTEIGREKGIKITTEMTKLKKEFKSLVNVLTTNLFVKATFFQSYDLEYEFFVATDKILGVLANEITDHMICPLCGREVTPLDGYLKIADRVFLGHKECKERFKKEADKLSLRGKKLPSVFIGLLSILLTVLLSAIIAYFDCFRIIAPLLGIFTYGFCRVISKKNKNLNIPFMKKTYLIMSLVGTILAMFVGSAISMYNALESIDLADVIKNYFLIFKVNFSAFKYIIYDILLSEGLVIFEYFILKKQEDMRGVKIL